MTEGCTNERRQHDKVTVEVRSTTSGGLPTSYGNRVENPCYLDWLKSEGHLGRHEDAVDRHGVGLRLRNLWLEFNARGSDYQLGSPPSPMTIESDIGSPADIAETKYVRIMRAVPNKYRVCLRTICVDDVPRQTMPAEYYTFVQDALDALYGAFWHVEKNS